MDGNRVTGVDCFSDNYSREEKLRNIERARQSDAFEFLSIDPTTADLHGLIADRDVVFHLAGEPGVRTSWGASFETYLRNNLLATQRLLEAAKEFPETRFVFASSSSVYGQAERLPTPETTVPRPLSPYGATKSGLSICVTSTWLITAWRLSHCAISRSSVPGNARTWRSASFAGQFSKVSQFASSATVGKRGTSHSLPMSHAQQVQRP
jgi:UDP-glucose 4-epimerase